MKWVTRGRLTAAAVSVAVVMGLSATSASATTAYQDISSAGPLTNVYLGQDLDCQIVYTGNPTDEFYPPDTTTGTTITPGDCGTFVAVGGSLYGPDFSTNTGTATGFSNGTGGYVNYTPGSQSAVSGSGTVASPYTVTSTATAGSIGVSQVDSYVIGDESYATAITITNNSGTTVTGRLYHAADCYLQGSDTGYGEVNAADQAPACTAAPNNSPPGLVEEFAPLTAGSHYVETYYASVWADIAAQSDLPNTCDCTTNEDNGAGLNWDFSLGAGQSATYALLTNFSASGVLAGSPIGITPPTISGTTIAGQVLTEGHGTWRNNPTSYAYQWEDCDATGANCTAIAGATGQTYMLQGSDVGHTMRVIETGINSIGAGRAQSSAQTAVVTAPTPVTITTKQSARHRRARASISIPAGLTGENDRATLTGAHAARAGGTVTYRLYRSRRCTARSRVLTGSPRRVVAGRVPAAARIRQVLRPGRYYWQARYSGDASNLPAVSACGGEVLHVTSGVSVKGPVVRAHHALTAHVACAVVSCTLRIVVKASAGHTSVTVATGGARIKQRGPHAVTLRLTRHGLALARSATGKVTLRFVVTDRVHHLTFTSTHRLRVTLG